MFSLKKSKFIYYVLIVISILVLVGCSSENRAKSPEKAKFKIVDENKSKFSYDITFKWGSKFGGENPGEYYDSTAFNPSEEELSSFEGTQEEKITAYIKSVLDAFHALMDTSTYEVVVTAKLN